MPENVEVGPTGDGTYRYRVNGQMSADFYANRASALHAAMKSQRVTAKGLVPEDHPEH